MKDQELRRLQRVAEAAPEDGRAWLELAKELARSGRHEDAVESAYRAATFGADPHALAAGVPALRDRASPWVEREADGQCSRRANVRGPRSSRNAVRVEAGRGAPMAVDVDGSLLASSGEDLVRLDPRSLDERQRLPLHDPVVTSLGAFAIARRPRGVRPVRLGPPPLLLLPVSGRGPTWEAPSDEEPDERGASPPVVDASGRVHAGDWVLGPDLAPIARHVARVGPVQSISVARDGRVALFGRGGVELCDGSGEGIATWPHVGRPTFDDEGRLLLVGRGMRKVTLFAVDAQGRTEWEVRLEKARAGDPVKVGASAWGAVTVALAERHACYVAWSVPSKPVDAARLARIEGGRIVWTRELHEPSGLVVDREGVVYTGGPPDRKRWRPGLIAYDPDGATLFHLAATRGSPFLIDALGRLIAFIDDGRPELVAIG